MTLKQKPAERKPSIRLDPEDFPKLTRSDFEKARELFRKYDSNNTGNLKRNELFDLLRDVEDYMTDNTKKKVNDELERQGVRYIDLGVTLQIMNDIKEWEEDDDGDLNDDYVNAFVAMGGNPDRSGIVRKDTIINLIKNEFELTFDIEELFEKSSLHTDELDFQAFCTLFEGNADDEKSISRANSLLSILSDKQRKKNSNADAFTVRYRDFEKFLIKEKEKGKWFLF